MRNIFFSAILVIFVSNPLFAQSFKTITSVKENKQLKDGTIFSASDFPNKKSVDWKVTKQTLTGGVQDDVELIHVDNGKIKFSLIPTRGMSIYKVECGDVTLGWNSPVKQIVHPRHIDLNDHGGLGWLAGFNEMMVRCGVEFAGHPGEDDGKMLTLHGRVGNIPASEVSVVVDDKPPYRIRVRGKVEEKRFKFGIFELWTEVSTIPGSNSFQIADRLVNKSQYEKEYQIIYHANYGRPILEKGAKFIAPVKSVAPFDDYAAKDLDKFQTYLGPTKNYGEQVYCLTMNANEKGMTTVMLHNSAGETGVAMRYAVDTLPYFALWKNTDTESDGYVTGLEPATGFPYNRSVERKQNRVPKLKPGGEVNFQVEISVLENAEDVTAVKNEISKLQGNLKPEVSQSPPKID
jgi:hypothetical protein